MRVLLIDPISHRGLSAEDYAGGTFKPDMGLIYLGTFVKTKRAANVMVADMHSTRTGYDGLASLIKNFRPDLVGITAKTFNILGAYQAAALVKEICSDSIVLLGGAHGSALPEYTLNECRDIDAIAIGEGEDSFLDAYDRLSKGYRSPEDLFDSLPGFVWRKSHGQVVENSKRDLISDLDLLPLPDLSLVNYKVYQRVYNAERHKFQHIFPVFASRGCPFNCPFCMPLHTRRYRVRSVASLIEEIDVLHRKHGAERIYFEDSLFGAKKSWFEEFCLEYSKKGLNKKVQWGFETRIDTAHPEMFKLAKSAGCLNTFFGAESGSEYVRRKSNKPFTTEDILEKITAAKDAGLEVSMSLILGLPYETKETIEETLHLLDAAPCDYSGMNILDAYPGTAVFDMVDKGEGGLRWISGKRMNWDAYSRRAPMVEVNDLSADDLLKAHERATKILITKQRRNRKAMFRKRIAYAMELMRTDRPRLLRYLIDTFRGKK